MKTHTNLVGLIVFVLLAMFSTPVVGIQVEQEMEFTPQQLEFFENKVRPILVERCYECHEGKDAEGGLNLESRKSILRGGDTGPGIVVGDPKESLIIDAVNYGDFYEMPPDSKLPQEEIDILTKWVNEGAPWPAHSDVEIEAAAEFDLGKRRSEHWCWEPVRRPVIPNVEGKWAVDPIDQFIQRQVNAAGLQVAEKADRATLLRRACFDLIGLPPTADQIQAYVVEKRIDFEDVVDQLLESRHFGERWARHWMDLIRYAETCGHEFDYPIPHAYQYRDYLIRAFNEDVPYNQFVKEHIAGDLMTEPRRHPQSRINESILGTGFWFLGEATHGPVDVRGDEAGHIDNQIDVMSKTFLGVTVACARCHDHKFDAISTKDYYSLAGFLQSSRRQLAMLDKDERIKESHLQVSRLETDRQSRLQQFSKAVARGDADRLASYLIAGIRVERSNPKWFTGDAVVIQGESMPTLSKDSGIVETQEIKPSNNFSWQGNKQTWWRDAAKEGDVWTVEFSLPTEGKFRLSLAATIAADYGAAEISIDDQLISEREDFFAQELGTRVVDLGERKLAKGKHQLRFRIRDPHPDAIKRNMLGIDYLSCVPIYDRPEGIDPVSETDVASEMDLDEAILVRLVQSLRSKDIQSPTHPLHSIAPLLNGKTSLDRKLFEGIARKTAAQVAKAAQTRKDSELFADFDDPDHGWFRTGYAFPASTDGLTFSGANSWEILPPGVANSGSLGGKFFGVLRSPTFEITHKNIHMRFRGDRTKIRLIIDGFVMDEYNALLFADATVKNATSETLRWRTQSGDIKKYIGHRAHLEIIDHNDGFAAVDEVWFSNGAGPAERPSRLDQEVNSGSPADSLEQYSQRWAKQATLLLADNDANSLGERAGLYSWLLRHDLAGILHDDSESNVSFGNAENRSAYQLTSDIKSLGSEIAKVNKQTPNPTFAVAMADGSAENEKIFVRGNHKTLGEEAPRQLIEAIVGEDAQRFAKLAGSGRMELAEQIISPSNPLTARVMVNRIWHHITGRGIVHSVDNFGVLGSKPTNVELLDYLADEFVKDGWSMKRLIRRIMLSSTYQMSSAVNPAAASIDPDNKLMHRARLRRMQGEVIRDTILTVSGELDRTQFGRSVSIHLTPFMQGRGRPGKSGPLDGQGRRSVYIEVRRNFLSPMMLAFDTPIPFNSTGRRNLSNVPAQALILMNDPFVIEQAEKWAKRLCAEVEGTDPRIQSIYRGALGRMPSEQEQIAAREFIELQSAEMGKANSDPAVWKDFCHVMFNVKEFIHIK